VRPPNKLSLGTHPHLHDLSPLQKPSSFEDRRHRLFDPRDPRRGLLRAGEMEQVAFVNGGMIMLGSLGAVIR